jgi:hypothetical protein
VFETAPAGPGNGGETRPGGLRGRHQDRADAARQGSPTLRNPIQNDYDLQSVGRPELAPVS